MAAMVPNPKISWNNTPPPRALLRPTNIAPMKNMTKDRTVFITIRMILPCKNEVAYPFVDLSENKTLSRVAQQDMFPLIQINIEKLCKSSTILHYQKTHRLERGNFVGV